MRCRNRSTLSVIEASGGLDGPRIASPQARMHVSHHSPVITFTLFSPCSLYLPAHRLRAIFVRAERRAGRLKLCDAILCACAHSAAAIRTSQATFLRVCPICARCFFEFGINQHVGSNNPIHFSCYPSKQGICCTSIHSPSSRSLLDLYSGLQQYGLQNLL